jgi:hypothetical protein
MRGNASGKVGERWFHLHTPNGTFVTLCSRKGVKVALLPPLAADGGAATGPEFVAELGQRVAEPFYQIVQCVPIETLESERQCPSGKRA